MIDQSLIDTTNWEEHYVKRGDPSKPTHYIIRAPHWPGLFATFTLIAANIYYALSKGWLPVVDMQNYPSTYLAPEKLGKENAWEYYFEQPLRIGLEQAYSSENIVLSNKDCPIQPPWGMISFFEYRKDIFAEWRKLVALGLLKIKPAIVEEILAIKDKLFPPQERILGVHLRGTDYLTKPFGHPIQPPTEYAVNVVIWKMREWKFNKLFLATEDKNIITIFKESFGDCLLTFDKEFVDYKPGKSVGATRIERENDHFLSGKDYLIEMMLLSKCNAFVASDSAGNVGVMFFSESIENAYQFNLGHYGVYAKFKP